MNAKAVPTPIDSKAMVRARIEADLDLHPRRRKPFIRSAGVRFAVVYATIFGLSAFALAFSLWYATAGLLERQVQVAIRNDATALADHFSVGGLPSLVDAINGRLAENLDGDAIYLLIDPLGNRITGNLDQWPNGLDQVDAWYELPVMRKGVHSVALLRAYALDDGDQLLVGRDVRSRTELRELLRDGLIWAMAIMVALGLLGAIVIHHEGDFARRSIAAGQHFRQWRRVRRTGRQHQRHAGPDHPADGWGARGFELDRA
jgi:small-conductance mechanosensitive channel